VIQVEPIVSKGLQNKELKNNLYSVMEGFIPRSVLANKNRAKTWHYGYNEKYDVIIISRSGQVGEVINISGLNVALPPTPKEILKDNNYWERKELPNPLQRIQSIFQWNDMPSPFKNSWIDYIEEQFDFREQGYWFMNNGVPTYITGAHYMIFSGPPLILDTLTSERPIEYSIFFGRHARLTTGVLV
jgi:hypothetical protein